MLCRLYSLPPVGVRTIGVIPISQWNPDMYFLCGQNWFIFDCFGASQAVHRNLWYIKSLVLKKNCLLIGQIDVSSYLWITTTCKQRTNFGSQWWLNKTEFGINLQTSEHSHKSTIKWGNTLVVTHEHVCVCVFVVIMTFLFIKGKNQFLFGHHYNFSYRNFFPPFRSY